MMKTIVAIPEITKQEKGTNSFFKDKSISSEGSKKCKFK